MESAFVSAIVLCILIWLFFYRINRKDPQTVYKIKVRYPNNTTRLVLNQSQYEQFVAWENSPDGFLTIGDDDSDHVRLERTKVCAVEVKKR